MPHRAGYFVMAYNWDHHCHNLIEGIRGNFNHMNRELGELEHEQTENDTALLNYFKKLHYNKELYKVTVGRIEERQFVINSLGYRGYGANIDLLNALNAVKNDYSGHASWLIDEGFKRHIKAVRKLIYLPEEIITDMNTGYIVYELCKILELDPSDHIPTPTPPLKLDMDEYYNIMARNTPWNVNTAIFQRLFLNLGCSSMTIMKGTVGHVNQFSAQDLKIIGNRNFLRMYKETFANLHHFTDINIDLLKRIHKILSDGLVPHAGNFRPHDFPDRNGVTYENGNFEREISDLGHVLWETAQSFNHLEDFIYNMARAYYMFIGIHPFWDSNGRVGKSFVNYMFLKKGLPPISFSDDAEVLTLPRYGGTMEDMHNYFKSRILMAVSDYFYERRKLELFDYIHKQVYNVSFDSGFYFRQIDDLPQKLCVNFQVFILHPDNPIFGQLAEQCRVVMPDEDLMRKMSAYYGFANKPYGEWAKVYQIKGDFHFEERAGESKYGKIFDVDFVIDLTDDLRNFNYFICSIVSHEGSLIFNNKGLNYSYKLER